MWDKTVLISILLILAVITVHLISWIGSILHSVPSGGDSGYAVFTFRADQNKSMSTNILMNVLMPNVILVFLHMLFYTSKIYEREYLICYVVFYYVYRTVLICLILKRKELFSMRYETFNAVVGIFVAILLTNFLLANPKDIFIPVSELVNEFWLIVIAIIYKFIVVLLDKIYTQKKIVNEQMLDKYITNKFNYFYNKYNSIMNITERDNRIWILLFSIMIFENYNRGSIIRKIERVKVIFSKNATLGIMQIESNIDISDEKSIALAYNKLKYEIVQGDLDIDDEMQIEYYAFQYNPDEDYAKSISYIYQHLYNYLNLMPKFCNEFHLEEKTEIQGGGENFLEEQEEYFSEASSFLTIDDVVLMTGLTKKQVKKKMKKENICVLLKEEEVNQVFERYLPKG